MTLVPTVDGIGFNERDRDIEFGDELELKSKRAIEKAEMYPTKKNIQRAQKLTEEFEEYIKKMEEKYKV